MTNTTKYTDTFADFNICGSLHLGI